MRAPFLLPVLRTTSSSLSSPAIIALRAAAAAIPASRRRPCASSSSPAAPGGARILSPSHPHRHGHTLQASSPPPVPLPPTSVAGFLAWKPADPVSDVVVHGFVRSVRSMKAHSFVALGDGSSLAPLQAVLPAGLADGLANGAAVRLGGSWVPSPSAGQSHELHVHSVEILGPSDAKTFPIQKKYQTPEYLRTLPHLRARVPFNSTLLRLRSDVVSSLNRFFASRDFVQTHPPLITSSDCEGAGEVFTVSSTGSQHAAAKHGGDGAVGGMNIIGTSKSGSESLFFRSPKYLTVSTQLHLEALAQAVGSVWTLSPTFRAEESDTPRHLSEFYMLEAEVCFVDRLDTIMDLVEDMLRAVAADLRESQVANELLGRPSSSSSRGLNFHSHLASADDVARRWQGLVQQDRWPRITYAEALRILAAAPVQFEYSPTWEAGLQTEHEKYLAHTVGHGHTPVFVTHYPREIKAFYMLPSSSGSGEEGGTTAGSATVECFDLLVPEFCEIAGGSMREHRLTELVAAMRARGMHVASTDDGAASELFDGSDSNIGGDLDWYVDLRRWGCPPHGGFGVGFDRLLCYLSGVQTIRDTVAFPRWFGRCDC